MSCLIHLKSLQHPFLQPRMMLNLHQTVGDYLNSQKVIFLSKDGGCSAAWGSHQREKRYYYTPVLETRRIPAVILDIWRARCLSFLSCVGFMAQVMSKAPHVLLLLLFKWPICSHHNLILVTTYVFLVCPWVCHCKNVHVRCVKEMFPYL